VFVRGLMFKCFVINMAKAIRKVSGKLSSGLGKVIVFAFTHDFWNCFAVDKSIEIVVMVNEKLHLK